MVDRRSKDYVDFVGYYLPQSQQHRLNEVISDKDVMEIAKYITKWEAKLASPMELTMTEIDDLNEETKPQIQRQAG